MKKTSIISVLALTMAIGIGTTAFAASSDTTVLARQGLGLGRITSMRGYDFVSNILNDKLGLSDTEITEARDSDKTLVDLAIEEGITEDELKEALLEERIKAIDEAVADGKITEEEAEVIKAQLNTNIENCTGNFGQKQGVGRREGRGQGRRMMGNGKGRAWDNN